MRCGEHLPEFVQRRFERVPWSNPTTYVTFGQPEAVLAKFATSEDRTKRNQGLCPASLNDAVDELRGSTSSSVGPIHLRSIISPEFSASEISMKLRKRGLSLSH